MPTMFYIGWIWQAANNNWNIILIILLSFEFKCQRYLLVDGLSSFVSSFIYTVDSCASEYGV